MMRRVCYASVSLSVVVAILATVTGSASARSACGVAETNEGNFTTATCGGTATALSGYLLGETGQRIPNSTLWCVKTNAAHAVLRYTNAGCTTASTPVDTGQYGRVEGDAAATQQNVAFPVALKSKDVGSTVFAVGSGSQITCTGGTGTGELLSETEANSTTKFTGCTLTGGSNCTSAGASVKEIIVPDKAKILAWEKSAETFKTALLVEVDGTQEFACGAVKVGLKGSVTGVSGVEGAWLTTDKVTFATSEGKQEVPDTNKLEAKVGESGSFEAATQSGSDELEDFHLENEEIFLL
jgi:hypothetical protein